MTILQDYLRDLEPFVNIDCGSANKAGVTRCAEMMKALFESIGFTCELVDLGPDVGRALLARNKPEAEGFDVMMNAHLDTVFPDGTAAARPLRIEGDRAYGPGCSDCKGGALAMYYACKTADPADLERLSICCAFNPDEEVGSNASTAWLSSLGARSKYVLVFEAARAGGELVRSRKGVASYRVEFKGVAAHAGNNPQDGANANIAAMRFSLAAAGLADPKLGTTVNPGVIKGGTVSNVISDRCTVEIDTRYWFDEHHEKLDAELKSLAAAVWAPGVTQTFEMLNHSPAMPLSERTKNLVALITRAAELEGFEATWIDAGGGSDGNHIAETGVPVIDGCGPAGGCFHSDKEFLRLDTVEERIGMVRRFFSLI